MPCSTRTLASLVCLFLSTKTLAANADWSGVWQGTLGQRAIVACFPDSDNDARYYELKRGDDILLRSGKNPGDYAERKSGGQWTIRLDGNDLIGEWTAPAPKPAKSKKGKKKASPESVQSPVKHPIKLTRVPTSGSDDDLCSGPAYQMPRLEQQKIATGKELSWQGKLYRSYSTANGNIVGLELVFVNPKDPKAQKINQTLRQNFRDHLSWYFRCRADAGANGSWQYKATPTLALWSKHWLTVVEDSLSFCGGSYSNRTHEAKVYDLRSGSAVDVLSWFQSGTFRLIDNAQTLSSASPLGKLVTEQAVRQSQRGCRNVLEENQWYKIWPSRGGMVFYPELPQVAAACANEIVLTYAQVTPFLSYEGQTAAKELQQEFK